VTVDLELFADRLPTYLSRFVGRERELAAVGQLLRHHGLVTICGVGGSGKTRLGIEVARRWRGSRSAGGQKDAYWVPLATVSDPAGVAQAVATALGLPSSGRSLATSLRQALRGRPTLLLLDNCEHVVPACRGLLKPLLAECPQLAVVATSRAALHLDAERVFAIPGMATGHSDADASGSEAAELFVDRAATSSPMYALTSGNLQTINRICERLGGLPLAIELAASWIRVLSAGDLLRDLEQRLDLVASSSTAVEQRHRSLDAVLESSWLLLGEEDRRVMTALGSFLGGFTRKAAESVAGADLASLFSLAERSLIQRLPDSIGGSRFQVHELVRTYAVARLNADVDVADNVRARHLDYFLDLVEATDGLWFKDLGQEAMDPVLADLANVEAALQWALDHGDSERAQRMCNCLLVLRYMGASATDFSTAFRRALALHPGVESSRASSIRARTVDAAGGIAFLDLNFAEAKERYAEAFQLYEAVGDRDGMAYSIREQGAVHVQLGEHEAALPYFNQSLAMCRADHNLMGVAWSIDALGNAAVSRGAPDEATPLLEDVADRFLQLQCMTGYYGAAAALGDASRLRHEYATAIEHYARALNFRNGGNTLRTVDLLEALAAIAAAVTRPALAARLLGAADGWRELYGAQRLPSREPPYREALVQSQRQLGQPNWDTAFRAGARLSREEAQILATEAVDELRAAVKVPPAGLTRREVEVLRLVVTGMSNPDIAHHLVVSPRTVDAHLRSIFDKLNVTSRTAAAHEAARLNLV
jgi:predicted ATPase/DNA-binding CsgD family transcriptional regulator